jgi:drug/metabolite transporter (DMT)-like permease
VTAALWALASGAGFGLFQSFNRRAVLDIEDPYVSTFLNLAIAAVVLVAIALATEDLGQVLDADGWALAAFAAAGIVHFLLGWTFLNLSQKRIGASRTSPLLTMSPVFGIAVAAIAVGQLPGVASFAAIVPMVFGAYLVAGGSSGSRRRIAAAGFAGAERRRLGDRFADRPGADALPGLACALMWAVSPVLTLRGLDGLDSPLLGVTLGMVAAVAAYGGFLLARREPRGPIAAQALAFKVVAGVLVAFATWWRWIAIDGIEVGVVLALGLASVPVVLFVSPLVVGRNIERVTRRVWVGAGLVVGGALALIAIG